MTDYSPSLREKNKQINDIYKMLIKDIKYCYDDIMIVPAARSNVNHRIECLPYVGNYQDKELPIFTAPMSTVVNEKNFSTFQDNGITPILPRNFSLEKRKEYLKNGDWAALSVDEFEELFIVNDWDMEMTMYTNVLIDNANGHMVRLHDLIRRAKDKYASAYRIKIMAGNIGLPEGYAEIARSGVDYVRLSIGTGLGCLTGSNVGVGYGIASLIDETYKIKLKLEQIGENAPYIVADGGIRNYDDINKALALGADFVMIGSLFAALVEGASPIFYYDDTYNIHTLDQFEHKVEDIGNGRFIVDEDYVLTGLKKEFYGMASRRGQEDMKGEKTRTSEGVEKVLDVTTNLSKWVENMAEYIQTAFSYTNCFYLEDFTPLNVDCVLISELAKKSINK